MVGPFKAAPEQIKEARERKPSQQDPIPDDYYLDPEESQEKTVQRYKDRVRNPMTAIRAFCIECMGGYLGEVDKCTSDGCALYKFRKGKNPFHTRKSQEQEDDE